MSCQDCFRGSVHTHAEPAGKIETLYGIKTYVAGGSDPNRSKSTIIYLPDAFSQKLVNNKILADKYASATGCRVLFPDVVRNGGMPASVLEGVEYLLGSPFGVTNALPKIWTVFTLLPHAVPFMLFGHPKNQYPAILKYARDVRADLPAGGKLGVCGFCWGAWPSTKLCAEPAVEGGTEALIDAQFNGHPSYIVQEKTPVMLDSVKVFKVPYSVAVAEKDIQFKAEVAEKTEAEFRAAFGDATAAGAPPYEFKIYKGATHGFCVKAREEDMQHYYDAAKQATDWFAKYLN